MSTFKVFPIPTELAAKIRASMTDANGHQLSISVGGESNYGPCRNCLRQFLAGEKRILFSYSPNAVNHPYNETGPIYIHADACEPYRNREVFPPDVENGRIKFPLAFRCYNKWGVMVDAKLLNGEGAGKAIETLFENEAVAVVHARNAEFGCFIARIER